MKFNSSVLHFCKKIPKGKISTYKEIAIAVRSPKSFRAVGNALNKNPNPKLTPCHRVIKSDGSIGGYAFGVKNKIKKLKLEGIEVLNGKINLEKYLFKF